MRVELLCLEGCPHGAIAAERLEQALRAVGRDDVPVTRILVETLEQAQELGFLGSPSIRVDGWDPFTTGVEHVGLACRVYPTPSGLAGSPTTAQLVDVLS